MKLRHDSPVLYNGAMSQSIAGTLFPPYPIADYQRHRAAVEMAMQRVLRRGHFVLGEEVEAFEAEFAQWLGTDHVIGVGSGTDAIELMLRALQLGTGSKVVVPAFAPSAVASAVLRAGAQLVLADIEPDTFTLDAASLDAVLRSEEGRGAKAALVVHLFGHPADWHALQKVAEEHGILLLEDGAQAHGATWRGHMVGTLGHAAAFSFYPTKNLAAMGDAGAIATSDPSLALRMREMRQYGWRDRYISDSMGVNSRLDELQAAVLREKLMTLDEHMALRRGQAGQYQAKLGPLAPIVRANCDHARHLQVIRSAKREELFRHLTGCNIPVAVHYPQALHQQPAFANGIRYPESERAAREVLSLPLHPYLEPEAVDYVIHSMSKFADANR